jgi:hypothetical protein
MDNKCKVCGAECLYGVCTAKEFCEITCERERERTFAGRASAYIVLVFIVFIWVCIVLATLPAKAESVGFRNPIVTQEKATCANIMLGVQLADAYTTRSILRQGGYERDPLARGLVRSDVGAYVSTIVLNVAARYAFHRHPAYMCYAAALESAAVFNNLNVLERINK